MQQTQNPLLNVRGLIDYAAVTPEHIEPAVTHWCGKLEEALAAAVDPKTPATWDAVAAPLEDAVLDLSRAWGVVGHLQSVMDTPALRSAYNAMLPKVTALFIELSQNEALFKKYQAIEASPEFKTLSPVRQRILKREIRDFILSGAALPPAQRERVSEIGQALSQCSQKFSENLLDATNAFALVVENEDDLKGIPGDVKALYAASAQAAGVKGWRITLQYPSYLPAMKYADNRALREKLYRAFATRAAEFDGGQWNNTPLIDEILKLRAEEASLLGFKNYGELSLATKMAQSPAEVVDFLRDLARRAKPKAKADVDEVADYAKTHLGLEKLEAWDQAWASEKLREARYSYSDAEVKRYFTEPTVFAGLFTLVEKLFDIEIKEGKASVWHPDVKFFEVFRDGKKIAAFYADLYAREGKRSGACMDGERTRTIRGGELVLPIAYLVCNFAQPVNGEAATLTHDDVTTLFHEFGHTLNHILTTQTEAGVSGINGVEWDAVECPSQFMENFAWNADVVKTITKHSKTGEPIPDELFAKMLAARNFGSGAACVRQVEFALFDMLLHTAYDPKKETVLGLLDAVRQEVAVVFPPAYNRFPQSFSHIFAGGYAAGYYSYKWAEVLSADCFEAFEETGVVNPETGRRFLHEILERGSSRDAMENFIAFRGRKPEIEPLLRLDGIIGADTKKTSA